jgi:transposase-like protein
LDLENSTVGDALLRKKTERGRAFSRKGIPRDEELNRLQRENRDLKEANEILKKAVAIFSRGRSSHSVPVYR